MFLPQRRNWFPAATLSNHSINHPSHLRIFEGGFFYCKKQAFRLLDVVSVAPLRRDSLQTSKIKHLSGKRDAGNVAPEKMNQQTNTLRDVLAHAQHGHPAVQEALGMLAKVEAFMEEQQKEIEALRSTAEFYQRRCNLLQKWQSKMRDPERTIVCDILANGQTLAEPNAGRYEIPAAAPQPAMAATLSSRLRPDVECAPWVIDEVKRLEAVRKQLDLTEPDNSTPAGWVRISEWKWDKDSGHWLGNTLAGQKLRQRDTSHSGWLEAAVAWEVCASIHQKFGKGKDALFTTRQADYLRHATDCRDKAASLDNATQT